MRDEVLAFTLAPARARRQLKALLLRADPDFVRCAYLTAVRREPTAEEHSEALGRLAAGASRTAMLSQLLAAGADASGRDGPWWLRYALRHERLGRLSLPRIVTRLHLNPVPWFVKLAFRQFINEDPKAAFVMLERVSDRATGAVDPTEARVADRVYKDLAAVAAPKGRQRR
jgi:hypothetical protein